MFINQVRKVKRNRARIAAWKHQQQQQQQPRWIYDSDWIDLIRRYSIGSHIHGFYQLFWPTMRRRMRLLWSLALLCALIVLIYITYLLAERHQRKQFHTIVDDSHWPIVNIAFPAILVCNKNHLNWSRLPEIRESYNISDAELPLVERALTAFDAVTTSHLDVFESLRGEPLETLNHLNFTQIVIDMAWRCDELFRECSWHTKARDCCELFRPRRLPQGPCFAFNELEKRPSAETGLGTGISFRLMLNADRHAPANGESKGFVLDVVEPGVWTGFPMTVPPYADLNIGLSAVYHFYDSGTYSLDSNQRECLMDYEQDSKQFLTLLGFKYMLENCQAECQQHYMLSYCNCTLDLFYPPSNHAACKLKDLPCLAAHNHLLQNFEQPGEKSFVAQKEAGLICDCLYNCKSLTLLTNMRQSVFLPWKAGNGSDNSYSESNNRSIFVNFYYDKGVILVYKTSLIYSWIDLIVSFGAIFQLCLGCSIISLLELCFFGLFDVPRFFWTRYESRRIG
ncbi:pickpocket protein 19 [Drosophila navojoa]|uniref:pickpocket protein 19 n=1 Tax=Drosophila navojoa TaxID=7232 RepID=UPI0011BEEEFC|nr:pickpocket protein 19 [Drosophila navojoa]